MTTISIALTTFNGEMFLPVQLRSLEEQHRLPDEVVVVDDGSTDNTISLVEQFARHAPFPVILHRNTARLGWRGNFVRAASLCNHELVSFCDQDDIWYDVKLLEVERLFSDPDTLLVHHNADLIDGQGQKTGLLDVDQTFSQAQKRLDRPTTWTNPLGLTITFRRSLLNFVQFWPHSLDPTTADTPSAHDRYFYWLATNLGTVRYTTDALLAYRQHGGNAVGYSKLDRRIRWPELMSTNNLASQRRVLQGFCRVLETAQASKMQRLDGRIEAALEQNRSYLRQVEAGERAHTDPSILDRAQQFATLLRLQRTGPAKWHLGKRALIASGTVGVFLGR